MFSTTTAISECIAGASSTICITQQPYFIATTTPPSTGDYFTQFLLLCLICCVIFGGIFGAIFGKKVRPKYK